MEQELERIFRLMALLLPQTGLHDAYVGVRSSNVTVRANALEFLDNVLKPELRHVLVPVLDAQVTVDERIEIANRLVGARSRRRTRPWRRCSTAKIRGCGRRHTGRRRARARRSCVAAEEVRAASDPLVRDAVVAARERLAGDSRRLLEPQHPAPDLDLGVGAG